MKIERKCKVCEKKFDAMKITQFFCSRKCFKKDYYDRNKIKIRESQATRYPLKHCDFCNTNSPLTFEPRRKSILLSQWVCPICGITEKIIWTYSEYDNSKELINNILETKKEQTENLIPKNQVYNIPIELPEHEKMNIFTLACEIIDMRDIKKMGRKKVIFS